jgi:hypothetical protein
VSTSTQGRRGPTDARVTQIRRVLEALLESLDATVRLTRQTEGEAAPEPLEQSAAQLVDRLGAANRLAAGKFVGPPAFVTTTTAIGEAIRQLDAAFVAYRKHVDRAPSERGEAAIALDAEIGRIKLDAGRWE